MCLNILGQCAFKKLDCINNNGKNICTVPKIKGYFNVVPTEKKPTLPKLERLLRNYYAIDKSIVSIDLVRPSILGKFHNVVVRWLDGTIICFELLITRDNTFLMKKAD